jgi:hypothetical protein
MENKHLEWLNIDKDLESDNDLLEDFALWTEGYYSTPSVELTVQEGWQSLDWKIVLH